MGLLVLKPGLKSMIQDGGRPGSRRFGVPEGGAFDRGSWRLANALLGNDRSCAAIELTMVGGSYRALQPLALAIAGAPFVARLHTSGRTVVLKIPQSFSMSEGDELLFGGLAFGLRAYLAVRGGWQTPVILGSRSSEIPLQQDEILAASAGSIAVRRPVDAAFRDPSSSPIRALDGPDGEVPAALLAETYRVGNASDRMGLRLEGPRLDGFEQPDRASAPVASGAIQVAGGQPLILGVAGGTMGGYPNVAQVISADLDRLGQIRPGDSLRFERVSLNEARQLDRERIRQLDVRDRWVSLGAEVEEIG